MKVRAYLLVALCALVVGCVQDVEPLGTQGWLVVQPPQREDPATRADDEISYMMRVTLNGASILPPTPFVQIAGQAIPLAQAQGYQLHAESCTPLQAESLPTSYGQPRYEGAQTFDIQPQTSTHVQVSCAMANAAFQVVADAAFPYTSFVVTATVGSRQLIFTTPQQTGYFNLPPTASATLHYQVEATSPQGRTAQATGTLLLKAKTLSTLRLKSSLGQLGIHITYDDQFEPHIVPLEVNL